MAIFNKSDSTHKSAKSDSNTTIITAGSKIKGEINLSCKLYIDGEVEGTINSQNDVNIGKNGHVKGELNAQRVMVQGFVEGDISALRVEVKSDGRVSGTIESGELIIESKGIFEGSSVVKELSPTVVIPETLQLDKS